MPKYDQTRLEGNKPLDSYAVRQQGAMVKLDDPVARRIDAFTAPAKEATQIEVDPNVSSVMKSLDNVNSTVGSYVKLQEAFKPSNKLKGMTDQMTGKPKDSSTTAGFLNGGYGYTEAWDEMAGKEQAATKYQPLLHQFTADNGHLPPEEFAAKLKKDLTQPFLATLTSEHQVAGFVPEAMALQDTAIRANEKRVFADRQLQRDSMITSDIRTTVEGSLHTVLGLNSLEQLHDPTFYKQYLHTGDTPAGVANMEALSQNMYGMYRVGLTRAKALGKTTSEYSAEFLSTVAGVAKKYGVPELLQYAYKSYSPTAEEVAQGKKPDNLTVSDAFPEQVQKDISDATTIKYRMVSAIKAQEKEAAEKAKNLYVGDMNHKLFTILSGDSPNRYVEAEQAMNDFHQNAPKHNLTPEDRKYIDAQYLAVRNRGSFASHNDDGIVNGLYAKWSDIKVSDVTSHHNQMTEKTYGEMLRHASDLEQAALNRSVDKSHHYEYMAFDMVLKGLREPYMKYDKMTNTLTPESIQDLSKFDQMIGLEIRRGLKDPKALQELYQKSINVPGALPIRDRLMGSPGDNKPPEIDKKVYDKGALPPAAANKGAVMVDPKTKHTITSNGSIWVDTKTGKEVK